MELNLCMDKFIWEELVVEFIPDLPQDRSELTIVSYSQSIIPTIYSARCPIEPVRISHHSLVHQFDTTVHGATFVLVALEE